MRAPRRLTPERTADGARARAEYIEDLTNAWREDPEFGNALNFATVIGQSDSLKEYLASSKPLSRLNRRMLAGYIHLLERRIASLQRRPRGRPRRVPGEAQSADLAERNATWLVAFKQKAWREEHGRERVPVVETRKMIDEAILEAARAFAVPVSKIRADNIRNGLKTGRFLVP